MGKCKSSPFEFFKVSSPYGKDLDRLEKERVIELKDNGAARYLGRIGKKSGAFTIAKERSGGRSFLIGEKKVKRIEKTKRGSWYKVVSPLK